MPYRPKGSKVWWTSRPWRESTGTRDKDEAILYEAQLVRDFKNGDASPKRKLNRGRRVDSCILLTVALDQWSMEEGKRTSYHADLSKSVVDAFPPNIKLAEIDNAMIANAVAGMLEQGNAPSTINKKLRRLQVVLERAQKVWDIPVNMKIDFKIHRRPRAKRKLTYFLSHEMEKKMLELYADNTDYQDFLVVSIESGMRTSEVLKLSRDDLDWHGHRIHVRDWQEGQSTKNGEVRSVPMTDRCREALERRKHLQYPFGMFRDDLVIRKIWQRAVDAFNLPTEKGATPKCTRRTCGTRLAEMGFSQAEIAAWLGHKSLSSTEHYVNIVSARVDRMRELIDNARPAQSRGMTRNSIQSVSRCPEKFEQNFDIDEVTTPVSLCFSYSQTGVPTLWEQDVGSSNLSTPTKNPISSTTYLFKIDEEEQSD